MGRLLTISIAAYNVQEYLEEALNSILSDKKAIECVEVIVVNDGSTDNTLDVANNYKIKYPDNLIVVDKENGGYGSTINASLEIASGKYYKLLDGDDWFSDNFSEYLDLLEKQDNDLILSPYYRVYTNDNSYELIDRHNNKEKHFNKIEYVHAAEVAVLTDCIRNEMKISEHRFYTDTEYAYYVSRFANSISFISKPIYCYRIGREGQSISISSRIKNRQDASFVSLRLCEDYKKHNTDFDLRIADGQIVQIATVIVFYCKTLLYMDDLKEAKKEMKLFVNKISEYPDIFSRVLSLSRVVKICIKKPALFVAIASFVKFRSTLIN